MELKNVIQTHSDQKWKGSLKYFKDKNLKLLIGENNFNTIKNSMDETLTSPVSLMVYCFLNDIIHHPKCVCGKNNKFDPNQKKFSKYCCKKCSMENAKDAYEIRKNNNLVKYGVENVFQLKETKDKIKSTSLEKYGQKSYTKTEEYRNSKIQQNSLTCLDKFKNIHGDRYNYSKFVYSGKLEKSVVICSEHGDFEINYANHMRGYGCPKCSKNRNNFIGRTKEQFFQEVEELYGGLYDLSKFNFVDSTTKSIVVCPKHGEFLKTPKQLITKNQGCPTCSGKKKLTLEDIRQRLKYDYIIPDQEYINNKTKLIVICPIHGAWEICAGNLINLEQRCPRCAGNLSKIEEELREYISNLGVNFIKNDKKTLDKLELDILIPSHNLAIELNGLYHHSDANDKTDKYHLSKTDGCSINNIQLLHIFEDEWRNKKEIWKSIIRHKLGLTNNKIFARKCVIKNVNKHDKDTFLIDNHLQGSCLSGVNLGLYYNGLLVALLSMGKSRFDKSYEWEVLRYACLLDTSVVGGFQKLIKHFTKNNQPKNILTYADARYSIGNVYEKSGFTSHGKTIPNFFYFKRGEGVRYSRMKFQKHKLKDILKDFDEELTESDNMKLNGYCKIWDCGNYKYTLDL